MDRIEMSRGASRNLSSRKRGWGMGRKRKLKPSLKPDQLKKLAKRLVSTRLNIYVTAADMFGVAAVDDDFDALQEHGGIFRCDGCHKWISTEDESEVAKCCRKCYIEIVKRLKS